MHLSVRVQEPEVLSIYHARKEEIGRRFGYLHRGVQQCTVGFYFLYRPELCQDCIVQEAASFTQALMQYSFVRFGSGRRAIGQRETED